MRIILICIVIITFLGMASLASKAESSGEYEKGKILYQDKCQMCHGAEAKGNGPAASAFKPRPYDLTTAKFWESDGEKKIRNAVENGFGVMPPLGLKEDQTKAIIDYMVHTFKK